MNHSSKYRLIQEGTGKRVSKTNLQPYGVYKISTYKYADGNKERLVGSEETIIFVTGIYQKKVSALKLSNIPPANFFKWFKKLTKLLEYTKKRYPHLNYQIYHQLTFLSGLRN